MDKLLFNNVHFNNVREKKQKRRKTKKSRKTNIFSVIIKINLLCL